MKNAILLAGLFIAGAALLFGLAGIKGNTAAGAKSQWVYLDANGKLAYQTTETGDKIMDFSSAGYMGGGVAIPLVKVEKTVSPSGDDDTAAIQSAIDAVSKMPLTDGFRGSVQLAPGTFNCKGTLSIAASGVVLRGSGSGEKGTTIKMTGAPHLCISIRGYDSSRTAGSASSITDAYVPSGASSFHVDDASGFKAGDAVSINRPVTADWVKFMKMDDLVRDGRKETWLAAPGEIYTERVIKEISRNTITVDIPLTDSFDAKYIAPRGCSIIKYEVSGRISQVGVESLRILAPPQAVEISQRRYQGLRISAVCDAWVRDLTIDDTVGSVSVGNQSKRITVENVRIRHSVATKGAAKPADLNGSGSQILFDRCSSVGDNLFYFVTQARVTGPIVLLNCKFHGDGHVQPHQRWATGLLVDCCQVPESGIDFSNRGEMGSGHGWTVGWAVAWNCAAKSFVIQQPPGATNWAIGCRGSRDTAPRPFGKGPQLPEGTFDSHGAPVAPRSLYLAQLSERLGPQAVKNMGYEIPENVP